MPGWGGADKEAAEDDIPYFVNRAAHGQIHQFAIIVANQSHRFVKGIDGLNRPTNSFLYDLYTAVQTPSVPDQVFIAQAKVIKEAASRESCVIVGRCADYILKDRDDCLHTFIHASMEFRADRIVRLYGESEQSPEKRLTDKDTRRRVNYKHYTDREWGTAQNYHITLDSGLIGIEKCVDIILDLVRDENDG